MADTGTVQEGQVILGSHQGNLDARGYEIPSGGGGTFKERRVEAVDLTGATYV